MLSGGAVFPAAIAGGWANPSLRRTKVFWDIDTAPLPNWDYSLLPNIDKALAGAGLSNHLCKTARCTDFPPKPATEAIGEWTSHGVIYCDATPMLFGNKGATFRSLLIDILFNHDDEPSPVNYVLITGNGNFFRPLYLLRERGHNIVVARPSASLATNLIDLVATSVWNWEDLVQGQPPLPPLPRAIGMFEEHGCESICSSSNVVLLPVIPGMARGVGRRIHKYEAGDLEKEGSYPTVVWWDMDSTPPPPITDPGSIVGNIVNALQKAGFSGPVRVHAYGDKNKLGCSVWDQLVRASGATYTHLPTHGDRDASVNVILTDMAISIRDNPPPAYYFLISCDYRFVSFIDQLYNDDYEVFLARSSNAPSGLDLWDCLWHWEDLAEGGPPWPSNLIEHSSELGYQGPLWPPNVEFYMRN